MIYKTESKTEKRNSLTLEESTYKYDSIIGLYFINNNAGTNSVILLQKTQIKQLRDFLTKWLKTK